MNNKLDFINNPQSTNHEIKVDKKEFTAILKILKPQKGDIVLVQPSTYADAETLKYLHDLVHVINSELPQHDRIFVVTLNVGINLETLSKNELKKIGLKTNLSLFKQIKNLLSIIYEQILEICITFARKILSTIVSITRRLR
jgi:hypothetical protein